MIALAPEQATRIAAHMKGLAFLRADSGGIGYFEGWSLWSDGSCMIAVEADLGLGEWMDHTGGRVSARRCLGVALRDVQPGEAAAVPITTLREFALQGRNHFADGAKCPTCDGALYVTTTCTSCRGAGTIRCECDCGARSHDVRCSDDFGCAGAGKVKAACGVCGPIPPYPMVLGNVLGASLNLNLLAEGLRFAPAEHVRAVVVAPTDPILAGALVLSADGFRYLQMPVRPDEPSKVPVLSLADVVKS